MVHNSDNLCLFQGEQIVKHTKIVINVICYLKYFSLSVQIVFKYDYLSRKVWLTWLFYIISHFLCVFLYLV